MSAANSVSNSLRGISSRISNEMSEREVESAFLQEGFFSSLEYQGIGHDLRSEWKLPDNSRPDYATLDENQRVTAVYEFKNPTESLGDHVDQLFGYTEELKADFGILTNGHIVRVYRRENGTHTRLYEVEVDDFSEDQIADLADRLSKPRWDSTDADTVSDYISDIEPVSLANELGRDEFYNTF
ncbi:type I restriction enzyme HsdR N-terminal domain-containing protein [Halorubrum ezzemoulense]|uniref:type I restriction enzyme HsdR N-terminal domain-containing protein n=1 Tax=Halorubrum ezzemoulense TaxID=337243 RepID=UPI00233048CE|nr:type I restriction enzyme HsdR N-terminal domain-containing protein [Halorubrum ezzemoulense]MDB2261825.1 type I restriction enzyme HsdR N-terminal domain-containing protein [Halorubrum ezzemoulense]MDB2268587.1 type I restriction enzyme HsdR N-terminal domain-containing protein [Halorubrum ezzemoulense]